MTVPKQYSLITALSIFSILLSACGASTNQTVIATSVAQTMQAEHTQAAQSSPTQQQLQLETPTSLAALASLTPATTKSAPTVPVGSQQCTASAAFVSETIPDGTIQSAGSTFTKTWRIKNTGTCPWNKSWQFVYFSGDLLGAATFYQMPIVAPGDIMTMSVVLTAPPAGGSYRGYWKIQSPWGLVFGDEGSGSAFWVDIVVGSGTPENNKTQTAYGITDVTYTVTRDCTPANTFYHIFANISSNGPVTASFTWVQSDGNNRSKNVIAFTSASTKIVQRDWSQHLGSSENARWAGVIIDSPTYQEFPHVTLPSLCW